MSNDRNDVERNKIEGGQLYLVATPIGNLADMSERAIKVLSEVDIIAAEDTRNTLRLLSHFGISKPLTSYHEHNKREKGEELVSRLEGGESVALVTDAGTPMVSYHEHNRRERGEEIARRLLEGESCALVTDAGTPAISDPGEDLVALCAERGIKVTSIPGACAFVNALTLSALPTGRFVFEGFLPIKKKERRERLEELTYEKRTFILHEAPHKLKTTLSDMMEYFGADRRIALCRELTKLNEEVLRLTVGEAVAYYEEREPRGEYVIVVEGGSKESKNEDLTASPQELVEEYINSGMSRSDAIKAAAKKLGLSRNEVYRTLIDD